MTTSMPWRDLFALGLVATVALTLDACARSRSADDGLQRQIETARRICRDLGFAPGSTEFAQCAQTEFDRLPQTTQARPASPAAPPPPPAATSEEEDFGRWISRRPVCNTANCYGR